MPDRSHSSSEIPRVKWWSEKPSLPTSLRASPGVRSPFSSSLLPSHLVIHPKAFRHRQSGDGNCSGGRGCWGGGEMNHQTWLLGTAEPGYVTPVGSSGGSRPSPCFTDANSLPASAALSCKVGALMTRAGTRLLRGCNETVLGPPGRKPKHCLVLRLLSVE